MQVYLIPYNMQVASSTSLLGADDLTSPYPQYPISWSKSTVLKSYSMNTEKQMILWGIKT